MDVELNVKVVCLGFEFDNNFKNLNCENILYKYMCVLDVFECCKDLDNEWILILGVIVICCYYNSFFWE